jgi:hypothetical protein
MTNSQIIAELNRAKCEFQLRTICAVMDIDSTRVKRRHPSNNHAIPLGSVLAGVI